MRVPLTIIAALFFVACESKPFADLSQTASFDKHGVAFDYPGNWVLTEAEAGAKDGAKLYMMTVRTPSGAFVTVQSFEERMKLRVEDWADRLTKDYERRFSERSQTLEPGERTAKQRQLLGEVRDGLQQGFTVIEGDRRASLNAELYVAEFPGGTATVLMQGSAEDFTQGQQGFELVLNSLKWTRPAPDRETPTIDIVAPPNENGEPDFDKATIVVNAPADGAPEPAAKGAEGAEKAPEAEGKLAPTAAPAQAP
ncbi:MAG: hypothetical protein ACPGU1_06760 [Myxococcota bacterium]